ncbi:EamA family transporter [Nocardia sp. NPDC004582]
MAITERAGRIPVRVQATGWGLLSWVLFAGSGPLAKAMMVAGWSPAAVTSARIALAAVLLLPVVAGFRPRTLLCSRSQLWLPVAYGLLGVAGVQLLFFVAVAEIPVGVAIVLVNLAPAFVALWMRTARDTRLRGSVWAGIAFAITGLAIVAQPWQSSGLNLVGLTAGLGSAMCSAAYFLLGEYGARRTDPSGLTASGLVVGAIAVTVIAPPWTLPSELLTAPIALGDRHLPAWLVLLILAAFGTAVPYLTGLRALQELPPIAASVLAVVEPLAATVLAWLLLGQSLHPIQIVGAVIMLIGATAVQIGSVGGVSRSVDIDVGRMGVGEGAGAPIRGWVGVRSMGGEGNSVDGWSSGYGDLVVAWACSGSPGRGGGGGRGRARGRLLGRAGGQGNRGEQSADAERIGDDVRQQWFGAGRGAGGAGEQGVAQGRQGWGRGRGSGRVESEGAGGDSGWVGADAVDDRGAG